MDAELSQKYLEHETAGYSPERRQAFENYMMQSISQKDQHKIADFMSSMLESEVVWWIFDHATVSQESVSYEEFWQRINQE